MEQVPATPATTTAASVRQRRHVTFLFADLVGSSRLSEQLDPEAFHALIDQWLQAMTEEIEHFGGTLNQFSGDGILVLFGAPLAQEDAPVQACRAALALHRRCARLETEVRLCMRIGVDSGEIVAGKVGSDRRSEYAALGQRTNRAKRVQEQADPKSILLSQDTYDQVREYFRIVPAGEFLAKGLAEPVTCYRLIGEKEEGEVSRLTATMARWHSPLLGRATEMTRLQAALGSTSDPYTQVIAVCGDAGVGKSRLLYELAQRARELGFFVGESRSSPLRSHVPYAPFADILRTLCGITIEDPTATILEKVTALFPQDAPLLLEVVGAPVEQASQSGGEPGSRMLATQSAVERALHSRALHQPILLLFDDVHWSDPLSLQLTQRLAQSGNGRIVIGTASRTAVAAVDATPAQTLELQPLRFENVRELVAGLDGLESASAAALARWLDQQSGGLPLFIEELLIALQTSGTLRCTDARWRLADDFERQPLPGSVQDLIAARIERLPPSDLRAVQLAAIAGDDLSSHEAGALGVTAADLSRLESLGLLMPDATTRRFRFRSALTRRVVYRTIDRVQREGLHFRLAQALEKQAAQIDDTVLANHFHQGADTQRAIAVLRRAAARAEWAFANTDAVALLTQVIEMGGEHLPVSDHADVLLQRGRIRTAFLGDTGGMADIEAAIALLAASSDSTRHGRAVLNKGIALCRQFRFAESLEWLEIAERTAINAGCVDLQIETLLQRAFVLSEIRISGTGEDAGNGARVCCEQALALSREQNNHPLEVQALHSLGTAYLQELDYDRAQEMFEHCAEQARHVGDRATEALALQSLARTQQFRGAFADAAHTIQRLQLLLAELGDRRRLAFSTFNLAAAHLGSGHADEARQAAEDALPQAQQLRLDYLEKLVLRFLMGLYFGPQRLAQRIAAGEHLRRLLIGKEERTELSDLLISLADAYIEATRSEDAVSTLAEAAQLDIQLSNFARAHASLQRLLTLKPCA